MTAVLVHICHPTHRKVTADSHLAAESIGTAPSGRATQAVPTSGGAGPGGAARGFRSSGVLRLGLDCLLSLTSSTRGEAGNPLPAPRWAGIWSEASGTFWLSRLCRDGDAGIRTQALSLLARLAAPGAGPTRRMLENSWPEAPAFAVWLADGGTPGALVGPSVRTSECLAARAAAIRFLTGALGFRDKDNDVDDTLGSPLRRRGPWRPSSHFTNAGPGLMLSPLSPHLLLSEHEGLWERLSGIAREAAEGGAVSGDFGGIGLEVAALSALLQVKEEIDVTPQ